MKRIKRVVALLLAAAMCFSACPVSAIAGENTQAIAEENSGADPKQDTMESPIVPAADEVESEPPATEAPTAAEVEIVASGTCGTDVAWSLDTAGKLTISGTGAMQHYFAGSNTPWYVYRDRIVSLVVEEEMRSLGDYEFSQCTGLTSLELNSSLETIGSYAFRNCTGIAGDLVIPDSVTTIGDCAFTNLSLITFIRFGTGLTKLGTSIAASSGPFYQCTGVKQVAFTGMTAPEIPANVFQSMTLLESVTIPLIEDGVLVGYPVATEVVELLKNGGDDNNMKIVLRLTWDEDQGIGSQDFTFNDDVVASVYSSNNGSWNSYGKRFSMVITGIEDVENLRVNLIVVSGTSAAYVSPQTVAIT